MAGKKREVQGGRGDGKGDGEWRGGDERNGIGGGIVGNGRERKGENEGKRKEEGEREVKGGGG